MTAPRRVAHRRTAIRGDQDRGNVLAEPAANVARVAIEKGVPTLVRFFGVPLAEELASEGRCADLLLGNNVLAQVPDLNDFVEGLKILLKPQGVLTLEFPHLLRLMERNEFDTIVFADVLEPLKRPGDAIRGAAKYLAPCSKPWQARTVSRSTWRS